MSQVTSAKTEVASDAGHWYRKDGTPCYEVPAKAAGKFKATTLREARIMGLVPSVTTVTKIKSAPGLANWKEDQVLESAATMPHTDKDGKLLTDVEWKKAVKVEAKLKAQAAAERGTRLHTAIERHIQGKTVEPEFFAHVNKVEIELEKIGIDVKCGNVEKSFAHPLGYGGKVDLHGDGWIIDFKSKQVIEDGKKLAWSDHEMQLAAYSQGLNLTAPRYINVFVGVDDCKVAIVEHGLLAIEHGWKMFQACLTLWILENDYDPRKADMSINDKLDAAGL